MKGLIKTIKIEPEVREVLENMDWQSEGDSFLAILTSGQLDRALYVKVNKVLENFGGKWNRKAKGHLFTSDPRESILSVIEQGELKVERDGFFETPGNVVELMYRKLSAIPETILEPSAGLGAIVRYVNKLCRPDWTLVEKNEKRAKSLRSEFAEEVICTDFLTLEPKAIYDTVLMNPPFELQQDIDHVLHAFKFLKEGGELVSVMSRSFTFRDNRKSKQFREFVEQNGYWEALPEGSFKESGTGVNTVLVYLRN